MDDALDICEEKRAKNQSLLYCAEVFSYTMQGIFLK